MTLTYFYNRFGREIYEGLMAILHDKPLDSRSYAHNMKDRQSYRDLTKVIVTHCRKLYKLLRIS